LGTDLLMVSADEGKQRKQTRSQYGAKHAANPPAATGKGVIEAFDH
jgi:hypothetical protein